MVRAFFRDALYNFLALNSPSFCARMLIFSLLFNGYDEGGLIFVNAARES